ncbi:Glycosyl transferase, group 1 [Nitrospira sp. KM1]|uniref:glycosyltransferase family 4 protein n=1 Tax=Nitrospira sp. KM1 TaxID=1936990 RepID=UPI0013A728B4|nr:glycosyltransferase family 4 protein [Nitrospira sp. KM1]BCA54092.1 Glycosyl transferase, group 1 [Nitrospira sp. KM1]
MKVLWLGHNLAYPPKGGALQRNYNLIREISRKCEVHVLAFDQPITRPSDVTPQDCIKALSAFCASVNWVSIRSSSPGRSRYGLALRGILSGEPYDFAWLRSSEMADKLTRVIASLSPDVVHVDALGLAQYLPLLGKAGTVLNHHDVESCKIAVRAKNAASLFMKGYFSLEAARLLTAERNWCPQFGINSVVSQEESAVLTRACPGLKVHVVPNGVDTNYFTFRTDPGRPVILFCGSLDMHPNQEAMDYFLKRIWPSVVTQMPDVEFYIVGRYPPRWLEEFGKTDSRIHVTGYVDDVRPYFGRAAVCVCPIISGGGTRLKILDSLAMGVPVVSTPFAASGLSLEHERHLLMAETDEQFANETLRFLRDPSLRTALSIAGAECVGRLYSWTVVGQTLLDAYDIAMQNRHRVTGLV